MRNTLFGLFIVFCLSLVNAQNIHEVKQGETLYSLSKKYKIEISTIIEKNPQAEYGLKEGMKILIDESILRETETKVDGIKYRYIKHTIRPFETFYSVKNKFNLDREDILKFNPELTTGFRAGTVVKIPLIEGKTKFKKRKYEVFESVFYTSKKGKKKPVTIEDLPDVDLTEEELKERKEKAKKEKEKAKWFSPETDNYSISYLLPLFLDKNDNYLMKNSKKVYPKSEYAVEFYAGAQVALKEWKEKGMKADINVYDSENSKQKIGNILAEKAVKNSDVIVGPFYTENVKFTADFLKFQNVNIVAPVSKDHSLVKGRENVFQVQPSTCFQLRKTSEYISKKYGDLPVVVIRRDTISEEIFANAYTGALDKSDNPEMFRTKMTNTSKLFSIQRDYFTPNQDYVVIIASEDRVFITNVLTNLNRLRNKNLTTFVMPSIVKFNHIDRSYLENLHVHFPMFGSIDYDSKESEKFIQSFRTMHGHEPGERFAFVGYDVTNYVLNELYTKGKFTFDKLSKSKHSKLNFDFMHPEYNDDKFGFINQGVSIFKFDDKEGKVLVYPFKK